MKIEDILKTSKELSLTKKAVVSLLFTTNIVNGKLNEVLKPFDLSIQQFNVLRILRGQQGKPMSLATIHDRMINKMSNTTRLIDKLIKKQCVKKDININNRRKVDVVITTQGLDLLKKVDGVIEKKEEKIMASLSKTESQELIRLLGKIRLIAN